MIFMIEKLEEVMNELYKNKQTRARDIAILRIEEAIMYIYDMKPISDVLEPSIWARPKTRSFI